ncbi:uncharacterized protein [Lepisosteus oculatus]|uniref:uncharacterized protein isoform X2 n=1 Tax=Lepisosteus oculatus TaxID=7918 RepID=UPI0007400598|nr:PREDICTED: tyrosine-protein phosphatase non-receptor type substrate 1-like isoform X2 [Lepisosteus oculatus]
MLRFCLLVLFLFRKSVSPVVVVQPNVLVTSSPGKSVTLRCSISHSTANYFSWFKQVPGQAPKCILTVYAHSSQATRYGEFINDTRFEVSKNISSLNLIISKTKPSDVGTYYCGVRDYDLLLFGNGTFLDLKGSESISRSVVQQPVSAPVRPGDNATLQCTIHMETCAGDHSVYWFRHDSEESLPGIIYTYENRSDHCERSSVTGAPTQNCVYNLPKRNISPSDAGTYYCAVATCGEILFGNGTLLDISGMANIDNIVQPSILKMVQPGDSVTLECFLPFDKISYMLWFKQTIGQGPRCILRSYYLSNDTTFFDEFKKSHFMVEKNTGKGFFHLIISRTKKSDTATYYCATAYTTQVMFGNGTLVIVKESGLISRSVVQQPVSVPVQQGNNVTLQCTIHTETCAGEHSVYWFRHGSGESLPGIIYTQGNRSDQCERISVAKHPTQTCVYNLPKRNLGPSDAGTYYCAVAICGEILFGNGTELEITGNIDQILSHPFFLGLLVSNAVCVMVIVVLNYAILKKKSNLCTGHISQQSLHEHTTVDSSNKQNEDTDVLNYAALSFADSKTKTGKKRRKTDRQSVYSEVRYEQHN